MTVSVRKTAQNFRDRGYEIVVNGQVEVVVLVHDSKGAIEVQFPTLARTEPHTVVLTTNDAWVESRDPQDIVTPPVNPSPPVATV